MPTLSVCIPSYNTEAFVRLAVRSALSQSEHCLEIVVVDDGSTDNTVAVVEAMAHPKLRVIRKEHSGAPLTRNRLIEESKGDYILWHDSDDILPEGTLRLFAEEIAKPDPPEILHGDAIFIDREGRALGTRQYPRFNGDMPLLMRTLAAENPLSNNSTTVARRVYERVGPYNPEFRRAHDYELWVRSVPEARFWHVGRPVSGYRLRGEGALTGDPRQRDTSFERRAIALHLSRHPLERIFADLNWADRPGAEAVAQARIAHAFLRWRDPETAVRHATRSLQLRPGRPAVLVLAEALVLSGRGKDAFQLLRNEEGSCDQETGLRALYALLKEKYGATA